MSILREEMESGRIDLSDIADPAIPAIDPIPPGVLLREEWLDPLGITAYRLAKDTGVPANRVTSILAGTRAITADTALRLSRYFGTDAQSWMNLQTRYDLAVQKRTHGAEIDQTVRPRNVA